MNLNDVHNFIENLDDYDKRDLLVDVFQLYFDCSTGKGNIEIKWVSPSPEFTKAFEDAGCFIVSQAFMYMLKNGVLPKNCPNEWNKFVNNI